MGLAPAPVAVVTGRDRAGAPLGLTVSSFTSISLEPPLALISVGLASITWRRLAASGRFAVNLLAADQEQLARRFAAAGARFEGVEWEHSPTGLPVLADAYAVAELAIFARHEAGDHEIVIGRPLRARVLEPRPPLIHHRSGYATAA